MMTVGEKAGQRGLIDEPRLRNISKQIRTLVPSLEAKDITTEDQLK